MSSSSGSRPSYKASLLVTASCIVSLTTLHARSRGTPSGRRRRVRRWRPLSGVYVAVAAWRFSFPLLNARRRWARNSVVHPYKLRVQPAADLLVARLRWSVAEILPPASRASRHGCLVDLENGVRQ